MAAVVHHGGAGTTGAGLKAGLPSILTPFAGDQWAWADLVVKSGVGLRPSSGPRVTAEKLAVAIRRAVEDPSLRARVPVLGEKIRTEDGVGTALDILERHAAKMN
jgi:sterol 3beta-glucosyltransferase